jgi:hypothetical protein
MQGDDHVRHILDSIQNMEKHSVKVDIDSGARVDEVIENKKNKGVE